MHRRISLAVAASSMLAVSTLTLSTLTLSPSYAASDDAGFDVDQVRIITFPIGASGLESDSDGNPKVHWSDTWGAPRSGGRGHEGVDMMGPKMTPLVAAASGEISWMRSNGNNMLVITDADGWQYWYIHINNDTPGTDDGANNYDEAFAPGVEVGAQVVAGQVIAYMGDSGNAEGSGSHLHFEIENPEGNNINPTPSVDSALARSTAIDIDPALVHPFETFDAMISTVYPTFVGRAATASEHNSLAQAVVEGGLFTSLSSYVDPDSRSAAIDRLYFAVFNRVPDLGGYRYWMERGAEGMSLAEISEFFAGSPEYETRFGSDNFGEMLDQIYLGMFDRAPDESGKAYWLGRLEDPDDPVTPGTVVSFFSEGTEARGKAGRRGELVALSAAFLDRMPTAPELEEWSTLRTTLNFSDAAIEWFTSVE